MKVVQILLDTLLDVSDRSKSDPANSESRLRANESVGRSNGSDTGIAEVVEAMMVVTV